MGNNNTLTVTVTLNGIDIDIITRNGFGYVLSGTGPNDFAELVKPEHMTDVQKSAAINTVNYGETPLGVELAEEAGIIAKELADDSEDVAELPINLQGFDFEKSKEKFNDAVEYLENLSGSEFVMLVIYSQINHNKFPEDIKELEGAVNADDAWCSAIINKARKINKEVEEAVFNTFVFDKDFVKVLRNKKEISVDAKVSAYISMYNNDCGKMGRAYEELDRLERAYIKFMTDIANDNNEE